MVTITDDHDERALIEAAQADPARFGELYDRHFHRVYAYVIRRTGSRTEAEDITSQVFERALSNLARFEWRGVPFVAWLYRIAHNLVANHHRTHSRWKLTSLEDLELTGKPADGPERVAEVNERKRALWSAIRRQPEERQRLLILKYADRLSNEEIGEAMGRTESAIKSLYFRTLKALKADLEARGW